MAQLSSLTRPNSNISDAEPGFYQRRGSFQGGGIIETATSIIYNGADKKWYQYVGSNAIPFTVFAGTTVSSDWKDVGNGDVISKLFNSNINGLSGLNFTEGGTLNSVKDFILDKTSNTWYFWGGVYPKNVSAASTPETTGGISDVAWVALNKDITLSLSSVSDLKSFDTSKLKDKTKINLSGYYPGSNHGCGVFYWDKASNDNDDGGYTINPTGNTGAGRWKRQFISAFLVRTVSPTEFGAKPDDTTFDSAPAINAAISYLNPFLDTTYENKTGGDIIFPTGLYYVNDTIYGAPGVRLLGTGGTAGFRFSRVACTCVVAMPTMSVTKVLFDTAPYLVDGSGRYKRTDEIIYGRTESNGYYGTYIENIVFIGLADTQCAVRIWRVVDSKLIGVAVYNCKVGFWFNGSWDISMRDCFSYNPKYAVIYCNQCTTLHISHGYFTGNPTFSFNDATAQWFHRATGDSNKPNIAYVSTFLYAYNSFDITLTGVTIEGCNRDFALFFCGPVNMFGGYTEHLGSASTEVGHRVFVQAVATDFLSFGTYFNHESKDLVIQSGNTVNASGDYVDQSRVYLKEPHVVTKFQNLTKDLGYGNYNIMIDSPHYITDSLATTLTAQRLRTVQFSGLLDQYTMRTPTITANGTTSFSLSINNIADGGEYDVRFLLKSASGNPYQDLRFTVTVGTTCTVTNYQARSKVGTTTFAAPTATFASGILTLNFTGNSGNYSVYRIKCVPTDSDQVPFAF